MCTYDFRILPEFNRESLPFEIRSLPAAPTTSAYPTSVTLVLTAYISGGMVTSLSTAYPGHWAPEGSHGPGR